MSTTSTALVPFSNSDNYEDVANREEEEFNAAVASIRAISSIPDTDVKLKLYGLYKQALFGDCSSSRPWAVNVEGCYKWDAWTARKGLAQDDAKAKYVRSAERICARYGGGGGGGGGE